MNRIDMGLFLPSEVDPTYHLLADLETDLPPLRWTDFLAVIGAGVWEVVKAAFCIFSSLAVVLAMYALLGGGK